MRPIKQLLSRHKEKLWLKQHKDDPDLTCRQPVRAYSLHNGDTFVVDSRLLFNVFAASSFDHMFVPVRNYRKFVWYKPSTWFKTYWEIRYIENPSSGEKQQFEKCDISSDFAAIDVKKLQNTRVNSDEMSV